MTEPKDPGARPPSRNRRLLLTGFLVGVAPLAVLAVLVEHFRMLRNSESEAVLGGVGGLWGFTAGMLRKSLLRTLVGLNVGAGLGILLAELLRSHPHPVLGIAAVAVYGACLGTSICVSRTRIVSTAWRGALFGTVSFALLGFTAWGVTKVLDDNLLGWTVMCLGPFGLSLALFTWLTGRPEPVLREPHPPTPPVPPA